MKAICAQVGIVFQYPEHQLFAETVFDDIAFGPRNLGFGEDEVKRLVKSAMNAVSLSEELCESSPFKLSGGEKRRAAIAGVLAMKPEMIILDEPTAGLDPKGRDEILDQIALLHKERKITVVLVSHSMEDVAKYVDRIIVMNQGEVMFDDIPKEVFKHYKELEAVGLAAPQVTYLMNELKEKGFPVAAEATTVEEAEQEILQMIDRVTGR